MTCDMFGEKEVNSVAVLITKQCNMQCSYCYIKQKEETFPDMLIDSLVEFIKNTKDSKKRIIFLGGEPLLEFEKIKKICQKIDELKEKETIKILNTNGTLLSREILDNINIFDIISFSIDGKCESHDIHRKMKTGKGSVDNIEENIKKLIEKFNGEIVISSVITPETAQEVSSNAIYLYEKFKPNRFRLGVAMGYFGWNDEKIGVLSQEIVKLDQFIRERKLEKYFPELYETRKTKCMLDSLSIDTNGDIYPCEYVIDRGIGAWGNIKGELYYNRLGNCMFDPNDEFCTEEKCVECNAICRRRGGETDRYLKKAQNLKKLLQESKR